MNGRSTGFGIGNRFKPSPEQLERQGKFKLGFTHLAKASPLAYEVVSEFDIGKPGTARSFGKANIFSIGLGRETYRKVYVPGMGTSCTTDSSKPGPGAYEYKINTIGYGDKGPRLQGRSKNLQDPIVLAQLNGIPGPGTYETDGTTINKYGRYCVSKIQNSRAAVWSPAKRIFNNNKEQIALPGPGNYDINDKKEGNLYVLSKYKNTGTTIYHRSTSVVESTRLNTPGPGSYMAPSDFGYLEMNRMFKPTNFMKTRNSRLVTLGDTEGTMELERIRS